MTGPKTNPEYRSNPLHALSIFRLLHHHRLVSSCGDPQNETSSLADLFLVLFASFWRDRNFGWDG